MIQEVEEEEDYVTKILKREEEEFRKRELEQRERNRIEA